MAKKHRAGDLVMVEWEDSAQPTGAWVHLSDICPSKPISCVSVGWVVYWGEVIGIAQNVGDRHSENAQASGIMRIAGRSVIKITKLKEHYLRLPLVSS